MGRRSWIHIITHKRAYDKLEAYIKENDIIFLVGAAIIEGALKMADSDSYFGVEGKKSLVALTQSDGSLVIDDMIEKHIIEDWHQVLLLDNVADSEVEHSKEGTKLRKATYLTYDEFEETLALMEHDDNFNNSMFQSYLEDQGTGVLFLCYICQIIIAIFTFLQEHEEKKGELLFSTAQGVLNDLGYWCFIKDYPSSLVLDSVSKFMDEIDSNTNKQFKTIAEHIKFVCTDLLSFMEKAKRSSEKLFPEFNVKEVPIEIQMYFWQFGELQTRIMAISKSRNIPIPLQSFVTVKNVFVSLAEYIYGKGEINEVQNDAENVKARLETEDTETFKDAFHYARFTGEKLLDALRVLK